MSRNNLYTGYAPQTVADFPSPTPPPAPTATSLDTSHLTRSVSTLLALTTLLFLLTISVLGFSLDCPIGLCDNIDRSSAFTSHLYQVYQFIAPLPAVWIVFSSSLLAAFVALLMLIYLIRLKVSPPLQQPAACIRNAVHTFHTHQALFAIAPLVPLFLLTAFATTWRTALSFLLGIAATFTASVTTSAITTRMTTRIAAAAITHPSTAHRVAMRVAAATAILTKAVLLIALAISYLALRDVRSLIGFVFGAALVALHARQTAGCFAAAARAAAGANRARRVHYPGIGTSVGTGEQLAFSGFVPDVLTALAASVASTAISGASLPYFYAMPYAMCVFNHLDLDATCAAFRVPTVKQSLAASLCRREGFYEGYPVLSAWESNTAFVALPFIIALIGLLATVVGWLFFIIPGRVAGSLEEDAARDQAKVSLRRGLMLHVGFVVVMVIAASAGVCWGLFGNKSSFYRAVTTQVDKFTLPNLDNMNVNQVCRPADPGIGEGRSDIPPLDVSRREYMPFDAFGKEFPRPGETARRLFGCIVLGLFGGLIVGGVGIFTEKERGGGQKEVLESFGTGLYGSAIPLAIVVAILAGANKLFGLYGIGLSAVGMLTMSGITIALEGYGCVAEHVHGIAEGVRGDDDGVCVSTGVLKGIGGMGRIFSKGISHSSAMLAGHALVTIVVQQGGLVAGSRELGGSAISAPTRHITDLDAMNVLDIVVIMGVIAGLGLPFLVANVSVSATGHTSVFVTLATRRQMVAESDGDADDVLRTGCWTTMVQSVGVVVTGLVWPVMIGLGLGKRALIGAVSGAIASGFVLAVAFAEVERGMGGVLVALVKMVPATAGIVVGVLESDAGGGWIGGLVFVGWVAVMGGLGWRNERVEDGVWEVVEEVDGRLREKVGVNRGMVSPFYEEGPCLEREAVHPGSVLGVLRKDAECDEGIVRMVCDEM